MLRGPDVDDAIPLETLAPFHGNIILRGRSGTGKTTALRHLVSRYPRLVVFLLASDCRRDVLEAIQDKLHGVATDRKYLSSLIHAGALDVVVDGLNEAHPDTRAAIVQFTKTFPKGNLLLATQPTLWEPPETFVTYDLVPLDEKEIKGFLRSRFGMFGDGAVLPKLDYEARCDSYVDEILGDKVAHLDDRLRVMSNPLDLSIVAQILVKGHDPSLVELQQQYLRIVFEVYQEHHHSASAFPLKKLADVAYEQRLNDTLGARWDTIEDDLAMDVLQNSKVIVPYFQSGEKWWGFRHDKIADFILVEGLFRQDMEMIEAHVRDGRFRGVYLQLAEVWPLDERQALEMPLLVDADSADGYSLCVEVSRILHRRTQR